MFQILHYNENVDMRTMKINSGVLSGQRLKERGGLTPVISNAAQRQPID